MEQPVVDNKNKKKNKKRDKLYDRLLFVPFVIHTCQTPAIAVLRHLGIDLYVRSDVEINAHAVQAGIRHRAEYYAATKLLALIMEHFGAHDILANPDPIEVAKGIEVGILYPRTNEVNKYTKLFSSFGIKCSGEYVRCPITFVPLRDTHPDPSRGRYIVNPERIGEFDYYICSDALYYFTPEELYRKVGQSKVVAVFHNYYVNQEDEDYLFIEHYTAPESVMVVEEEETVPVLDEEGDPVVTRQQIQGQLIERVQTMRVKKEKEVVVPAINYLATISHYKGKTGELVSYPLSNSSRQEAAYRHPLRHKNFMDHNRYVFDTLGEHAVMHTHVHRRVGHDTIIMMIVYECIEEGEYCNEETPVIQDSLVVAGYIPALEDKMRNALGNIQLSESGFKDFHRVCRSHLNHLLATYHTKILFFQETIEKAFVKTQNIVCREGVPIPLVDGPLPRDAAMYQKASDYTYMGFPDELSEGLAACATAKDKIEFAIAGFKFMCEVVQFSYEKLKEILTSLKNYFVDVYSEWEKTSTQFNIFENSTLILGAKLLFTGLKRLRQTSAFVNWARKYVARWDLFETQNPILSSLIDWSFTLVLSFVNAFSEEIFRRSMGQIQIVSGTMAIVEITIDIITYLLEGKHVDNELRMMLARNFFRVVVHMIMSLIPLPLAVLAHTITNMLRKPALGRFRVWFDELCAESLTIVLENVQDSMLEVVALEEYPSIEVTMYGELVGKEFIEVCCDPATHFKHKIIIPNNISQYMVRPSGTVRGGLQMMKDRFIERSIYSADVTYINRMERVWLSYFPYADRENKWSKYTRQELLDYVDNHPGYDVRKRLAYHAWCEQLVDEKTKVECYTKTDETLVVKERSEGVLRSKGRPIHPMSAVLLEQMCITTPYKESLGSFFSFPLWDRNEANINGVDLCMVDTTTSMASFYYEVRPTVERLNTWFDRIKNVPGSHTIVHGDDNFTVLVYFDHDYQNVLRIRRKVIAGDIKKADISTSEVLLIHMTDDWRAAGVSDQDCDDYVGLSFKDKNINASDKVAGMNIVFKVNQTNMGICTGVPATSPQNAFTGLRISFANSIEALKYSPDRDVKKYCQAYSVGLSDIAARYGVEMIVEPGDDIGTATFLGGIFVDIDEDVRWCRLSHYKALFLAPDVENVYQGTYRKEQHLWAALQDPYLFLDPVGRAFTRFEPHLRKILQTYHVDLDATFERYINTLGSWDQVQFRERMDHRVSVQAIPDYHYYQAIDAYFSKRITDKDKVCRYVQGIRNLVSELRNATLYDLFRGVKTDLRPYYFLRYGEDPKE